MNVSGDEGAMKTADAIISRIHVRTPKSIFGVIVIVIWILERGGRDGVGGLTGY